MSLPHDLAGSRSKNRFRVELLWGVSKFLELMETSDNFAMIFDYVCDIEIHFEDGFEFYQIKSRANKSYTTKQLVKVSGEGSILGKLYILLHNNQENIRKVALVTNASYNQCPNELIEISFDDMGDKEKNVIIKALKTELDIDSISLSQMYYIRTGMDLCAPDDAVRGKLVQTFERIKKCEPSNPNALYRLIYDSVTSKACHEYDSLNYDDLVESKGLTRREFDDLLDLHTEESKTGLMAAKK